MPNNLQNWLALTKEEPIDPELPIIDPHHHLWDYPASRYLTQDLLQDTGSGHNIIQTVFVECLSMYRTSGPPELRSVGETEFVCKIANSKNGNGTPTRVAAGIVGFADLTLGDEVNPVLEAHIEAGEGRFRGIRHTVSWHDSPDIGNGHTNPPAHLLSDPKFREGFTCLQKYDLSFDGWLYHPQLSEFADLAISFPDTAIILDHMGMPLGIGPYAGKRDEVFTQWKRGIDQVAACGNVAVKLGGLGMKISGFYWHKMEKPPTSRTLAEAFVPYVEYCIDRFGVERCMFESNFPVDKPSCSYNVLWNAFKRIVEDYTAEEKMALFHDTAARVYGI